MGSATDSGAWWAADHGVARVRHDLATKPPPPGTPGHWEDHLQGKNKTQQKMELTCLTMWKRAFRGGYNFVRASEVVTQKLKQKHPNKERGKVRQLLTAEVVQKLYRRFNTLS